MSILRIEPVRAGRDEAPYECVAENGVGDAVTSEAILQVYDGKFYFKFFHIFTQPKTKNNLYDFLSPFYSFSFSAKIFSVFKADPTNG